MKEPFRSVGEFLAFVDETIPEEDRLRVIAFLITHAPRILADKAMTAWAAKNVKPGDARKLYDV